MTPREVLRKVRRLRETGVALSDLVREAIDARFEQVTRRRTPRDVRALVTRILEQYPDPGDLPPRDYDVHDRRAAREAILRKVQRRRR